MCTTMLRRAIVVKSWIHDGTIIGFISSMMGNDINTVLVNTYKSGVFILRVRFVKVYSNWFCIMEAWGSSCPCHHEEWENNV